MRGALPMDELTWYVARTQPLLEQIVEKRLAKKDLEAYVPFMWSRKGSMTPLFPCYVFVQFNIDDDRWQAINSEYGVVKLLPLSSYNPLPIPTEFIDECRQRETMGEFDMRSKPRLSLKYSIGDMVPITAGSMTGKPATFLEQRGERVQLQMRFFNTLMPTWFPLAHVDPGTAGAT